MNAGNFLLPNSYLPLKSIFVPSSAIDLCMHLDRSVAYSLDVDFKVQFFVFAHILHIRWNDWTSSEQLREVQTNVASVGGVLPETGWHFIV